MPNKKPTANGIGGGGGNGNKTPLGASKSSSPESLRRRVDNPDSTPTDPEGEEDSLQPLPSLSPSALASGSASGPAPVRSLSLTTERTLSRQLQCIAEDPDNPPGLCVLFMLACLDFVR